MTTRYTTPTAREFDSVGAPLSGSKLHFYETGTLTEKSTFSDNALTTANANPVVADSAGRFGEIFLESGTYRVILRDSDDVQISDTDNIDGGAGAGGGVTSITASYSVTASDATQFLAVDSSGGALTITLLAAATAGDGFEISVGKEDSTANTVTLDGNGSETIGGAASVVLYAAGESVTVRSDGINWVVRSHVQNRSNLRTTLDTNGNAINGSLGAAVASDATTNIWAADGNLLHVTGTNSIASFGTAPRPGASRKVIFDDALVLTHSANLNLPTEENITTAAGDIALIYADTTTQFDVLFFKKTGEALVERFQVVGSASIANKATFEIAAGGSPDITHGFSAGYDYIIQLRAFCCETDVKNLLARYSDDGGITYEAGASDYGWSVVQGNAFQHGESDAQIEMTENMGSDAGNMSTLTMTLIDPGGTSEPLTADWSGGVGSSDSPPYREAITGYAVFDKGAGAVNGIRFFWETSSLFKAQGDVTVWRRARS